MYLAESLCCVGRYAEAATMLESILMPVGDKDLQGSILPAYWSIDGTALTPNAALTRAVIFVNKGATSALSGKLDIAQKNMEAALKCCPNFTMAIQGLIYVLLRRGCATEAVKLMRNLR